MSKPRVAAPDADVYRPAGDDVAIREDGGRGAAGWVVFAAVMMTMAGSFNAIEGLVALLNGSWLSANASLPVRIDHAAWGWTWLLFIPAHPFWALSVMVVDIIVIWALTAHGGELRQ